ncbi:MAG: DUF502 domain-containing protein [Rhodospirillales bacterium]|nr:DUF502 domain-containing protein [Rhodospirillales bacterium]
MGGRRTRPWRRLRSFPGRGSAGRNPCGAGGIPVSDETPPEVRPISFHLTLLGRLRAYLFAGILITAPISITIYTTWIVVRFVDERVTALLPAPYNPNHYLPFNVPGIGLIIVLAALTVVGWLTAGFFGRLFVRVSEGMLARMPIVRSIYGALKQIFETILARQAATFRQVVLVQFPREGMWRIGFITGTTPGNTQDVSPEGVLNVFVPNSPNITAGFLVFIPPSEIVECDLTPEEALKLLVSGGIAAPPPHRTAAARPAVNRNARA